MITPAYVRTMAAYNAEMNRRSYTSAGLLTEAERRADQGAFWGSLHGTLCHLLWADQMWMSRFAGWDKPTHVQKDSAKLIDDFDALRHARLDADLRVEAWAKTVDQPWLDTDLVWFSGGSNAEFRRNRALLLIHLFNHQTHHRGQVHVLLTRHGQDPGQTDLPWIVSAPR